jgi:hypothetical protein
MATAEDTSPRRLAALEQLATAVRHHLAGPAPERLPRETEARLRVLLWRLDEAEEVAEDAEL